MPKSWACGLTGHSSHWSKCNLQTSVEGFVYISMWKEKYGIRDNSFLYYKAGQIY